MAFWHKWFSGKKNVTQVYAVPDDCAVYAVGDIHGRADLLDKLIAKIKADIGQLPDGVRAKIIFLGDYIDRGFHSKEVVDYLLNLQIDGAELVFLAGNHEDMLLHFLDEPTEGQLWLGVGGLAALASYGVFVAEETSGEDLEQASKELASRMPEEHHMFFKELQEHAEVGDYFFVHAGVRPGVPMIAQRREDKLGIRREFTNSDADFGKKIVHGHSGVRKPENRTNRIAVDTGAFATGLLTAAVLTGAEVRFIST